MSAGQERSGGHVAQLQILQELQAGHLATLFLMSWSIGPQEGSGPPRWASLVTPSWLCFRHGAGVGYWSGSWSSGQSSIKHNTQPR